MQNFMGMDGFIWFTGVVEDRNDPSKLGRVRVRCVGFHTEDKTRIPTEGLPWAHVMHPVTDPSMSGMGQTPSFLVEGTWVVGFFRDAEEKQQPIIMGTLPGVPEDLGNPNIGFNDPNRRDDDSSKPGYNISIYPREEDVSDVNRLARTIGQEEQNKTILRSKRARVVNGVRSASGETWDEPPTTYNAKYPKNHVFESESGHIVEYDDTSGASRVHHYHKAGTFHEIDSVGNKVDKVEGINYEIKKANSWEFVEGDMNLTVHGTLNIKAKNFNLEVDQDYEQEVGKDRTTRIGGINSIDVNGEILETFNNKVTRSYHGAVDERYGDKIDRFMSGIVTNNHEANLLHFIKGGDAEFHITQSGEEGGTFDIFSEISVNMDTKTIDFDAETVASITSATTTINGSTASNIRGTTVSVNGTTVDVDATTYTQNSVTADIDATTSLSIDSPSLGIGDNLPAVAPTITSPSSPDVTLPTIGNELLLEPLLTPFMLLSDLELLESQTGAKYVNDVYPDAVLRGIEAEKKLGLDHNENDGMESGDGGGNSISPMTNNVADGTTDYNPSSNYNDLGIPNSAGFYPYNKKYPPYDSDVPVERRQKYDEGELLNFIGNADPRINPALGRILVELTRRFRIALGKPNFVLPITSAFRTPAANESVGGAKLSQHKQGNAVDVLMKNIPREKQKEFLDIALELGITGVGSYFPTIKSGNSFFHLDIGRKRHWGPTASWTSQYAWVMPILAKYGTTNSKGQILFGGSPVGTVKQTITTKTELKKDEQVKSGPGQSLAS